MAETVGQHSVAAFTSPVNGTSPIDANTVKGNDNTIRSAYVDHDADPGIHVQSSTLASRPVANSAGRKWMTQDSGVIRLFYDDGTNWYEVDYLRTTGGTISGNLSITGTLAVTGVATFTAQPILSSLTASRAVFTDGSKGLVSNAITGTGDVVMSASPTLTGTITAASATLSGTLGVSGLLTFASLKGTGATTVTNILDEDNMASDSATALATQQSIKAYVDAQVGASDALSEVLAIGNTTGANDIIVSAGQKILTPAVAAQDGSSAITIANTTGALTLATALADSNLATISTAGKVSNSATTATSANTASAIVARDASGNFTAGTITAALTGNASTATTLQTARNINGVSFNGSADITVTAAAGTLTGTTLASNVTASSLTSVGTLANLTVTNPITGSVTGSSGSTTGNAATATALQTARNINGVSFNGTADITVTAAAGTLTGTTLASGVTASSLTSVGTLTSLTVTGDLTVDTNTLKVDSTNNRVGIGTATPSYRTDISNGGGSAAALRVLGNDQSNVRLRIENTGAGGRAFELTGGLTGANNSDFTLYDATAAATRLSVDASGNLAVDTNTLYVDAANNRVGVGTASPTDALDVRGVLAAGNGTVKTIISYSTAGIFGTESNHPLAFVTNATERMRLDASGNLGLGVTPSAWSASFKALQVSGLGALWGSSTGFFMSNNTYNDGSNKYIGNGLATRYYQSTGQHIWENAPNNTSGAGAAATLTQAMTLDASGNLGVGTTSPGYRLDVSGDIRAVTTGTTRYIIAGSDTQGAVFQQRAQASWGDAFQVYRAGNLKWALQEGSDAFIVNVNSAERARITSGGDFVVGNTSASSGCIEGYKAVNNNVARFCNTATSGAVYGPLFQFSQQSPNNTTSLFLECIDASSTLRTSIRSNGGLANYQSNNVDLSDARTKTDITPAASMWDKIGALEIVTYKYVDQTHDDVNVGVIAQQVEAVEPVWVDSDGWDKEVAEGEEPLKTVYTKDITFAAIKALQEAMARIESLEARLAALES